jgi:hypothetical protein
VPEPVDQGDGSKKLTQTNESGEDNTPAATGGAGPAKTKVTRARDAAAKASAGADAGGR